MEGQPSPGNSQYQYQSAQWSRLLRRTNIVDIPSSLSSSITSGGSTQQQQPPLQQPPLQQPQPHQSPADLLPILLPQQPSFHQAQLAQYNRLVRSGGSSPLLSPSPLPPLLSAHHIQAVPGSRPGSSGGNPARNNKSSGRGGHGNKETRKFSKGERALITENGVANMPGRQFEMDLKNPHSRPHIQHQASNASHQSNSMPSTPHTHARQCSDEYPFEPQEPSPRARNNHSPRSAYSESNITLPSTRKLPPLKGLCRYETVKQQQRRRVPYAWGNEKLPKLPEGEVKSKLTEDEERKLTTDMRELYDRLKPSTENDLKRKKLVERLEKLFNDEWPGMSIKVHVFGSSGNLLCTDESDIDICITTIKDSSLKDVCMIAELLDRSGMQDVVCVSGAKIPIVKMVDPATGLLCDMNINSTDALENTRLVKTYVEIDPRVRPLAMIIKHWTKRRILNDAGANYALSSYTWINMIINFLQTRKPPILPSLHQRPHMKLPHRDGEPESAFADDVSALAGFGKKNNETLGELLFGFFRFYGHEFDYEKSIISVRNGKQLSKEQKGWEPKSVGVVEFCVEEPFNTTRNLANTADEYTVRGLHEELRRAFDLISEVKLDECCKQYIWPIEEKHQATNRRPNNPKGNAIPIRSSSQSQSNRGGGGGRGRGNGRHTNGRNGNGSRRASASTFDNHQQYVPAGIQMNSQDSTWLQQQAAQAQLSNDLYQTYTALQQQENSLRIQLYNQSQAFLQSQGQGQAYSQARSVNGAVNGNGAGAIHPQQATDRHRTSSFDRPPHTAPVEQQVHFYYPLQHATSMYGYPSSNTNPSSPSISSTQPELRRSVHRSSITSGSGGQVNSSMRSHSQPAAVTRAGPSPLSMQNGGHPNTGLGIYQNYRQPNGHPMPNFIADESSEPSLETTSSELTPNTASEEIITPRKYAGYYLGPAPPSQVHRHPMAPLAIPSFGDMHQNRRRQSTDKLPPSVAATLNRMQQNSRSPSPLGNDRTGFGDNNSVSMTASSSQQGISSSNLRALNNQIPAVVNGSTPVPISIPQWRASVTLGSDDSRLDTTLSQYSGTGSTPSVDEDVSGQLTPRDSRPESRVVANGNVSGNTEPFPPLTSPPIANGATPPAFNNLHYSTPNGLSIAEPINGAATWNSSNTQTRLVRQVHNGGMSPLDMGFSHNDKRDERHLSPVLETRTPSPTVNRRFEPGMDRKSSIVSVMNGERPELARTPSKLGPTNGNQIKSAATGAKTNGHVRASKSEGGSSEKWQMVPHAKKKAAAKGKAHGEKPPVDESERMGG